MELWNNIKQTKLHILEILEGNEERDIELTWKSEAENFPNLRKDLDMLIPEAQ